MWGEFCEVYSPNAEKNNSEKEIELTIKTTVKGLFKKKIVFEVQYGNVTDYAYSMADLTSLLIQRFKINTTELWLLLCKMENKYYKLK